VQALWSLGEGLDPLDLPANLAYVVCNEIAHSTHCCAFHWIVRM